MIKPYSEEDRKREEALLNYINNYDIIKEYITNPKDKQYLQNIFNINIEIVD